MCRNIRPLFNYKPRVTDAEIEAASLQYVRKVSGFTKPSRVNEKAFQRAVLQIAKDTRTLINSLHTEAAPKNRETEAAKARARSAHRFAHDHGIPHTH